MALALTHRTNWIANDGSYGHGAVITFEDDDLTPRQQEIYAGLDDSQVYDYIQALLNGDSTEEWENN